MRSRGSSISYIRTSLAVTNSEMRKQLITVADYSIKLVFIIIMFLPPQFFYHFFPSHFFPLHLLPSHILTFYFSPSHLLPSYIFHVQLFHSHLFPSTVNVTVTVLSTSLIHSGNVSRIYNCRNIT